MSQHLVLWDTVTNRMKRNGAAFVAGGFVDQYFDVVLANGQTDFVLGATITAESKIDVEVNGVVYREGVSFDFQRNVALNKIVFNRAVRQSGVVCIRVYA